MYVGANLQFFSCAIRSFSPYLFYQKPFKGKIDRDLDKAVVDKKPHFPKEVFNREASDFLSQLLQKKPENRMGSGPTGMQEIKDHPFFESIDWGLLEAGYIDPPFMPNKFDVNAASLKDIGDFDTAKYRHVKLDAAFKETMTKFNYISTKGLQVRFSFYLSLSLCCCSPMFLFVCTFVLRLSCLVFAFDSAG